MSESYEKDESFGGEQPRAAFGADLSKEEYVRFSLTAGRNPRRTRNMRVMLGVSCGVAAAMSLVYLLMVWQESRAVDWQTLILLGCILLLGVYALFGIPAFLRRRAEKQYEQSLAAGHTYFGAVRVYDRRIEKETAKRLTVIPLNRETRFLEQEDLMAFARPGAPALILFARYLTEEHAEVIRQTVFENLPPENCQLIARLRPGAPAAMPVPAFGEREEEEPLLTVTVRYTPEESYQITREMAHTVFLRRLPLFGGTALLGGLALWLADNDPVLGAGFCALMLIVSYLMQVVLPLRRAKTQIFNQEVLNQEIILTVNKNELTLTANDRPAASMPWRSVTRAVSEPDYIRLYADQAQLVIPKRCLDDVDAFCRMVDFYRE